MKIENSGLIPLSTKPTEATNRIDKKEETKALSTVRSGQDKVEMSDNARLLAKARATLGSVEEANPERLEMLQKQIESGDYKIQVNDLAKKLVARFYPK